MRHLLSVCPGVVISGSWETAKLISKLFVQVCTPTKNGGMFLLLHILTTWVFILAIVNSGRWNLLVILICISLMIKDIEAFFKCFLATRDNSVVNSLPCLSSIREKVPSLSEPWRMGDIQGEGSCLLKGKRKEGRGMIVEGCMTCDQEVDSELDVKWIRKKWNEIKRIDFCNS